MVDEIDQFIPGKRTGECNGYRPCFQYAEVERNPVRRVHGTEADVLAWLHPKSDEACGNAVGIVIQLSIGQLRTRLAESRPIGKEERRCF